MFQLFGVEKKQESLVYTPREKQRCYVNLIKRKGNLPVCFGQVN